MLYIMKKLFACRLDESLIALIKSESVKLKISQADVLSGWARGDTPPTADLSPPATVKPIGWKPRRDVPLVAPTTHSIGKTVPDGYPVDQNLRAQRANAAPLLRPNGKA